jgi:hypothetical protein
VRSRLGFDPAVRSAMQLTAGDLPRIYPVILPQGATFPAISYQQIDLNRPMTTEGPSGLSNPRMQFSCWASNYTNVRILSTAVRESLEGFRGTLPDADSTKVKAFTLVDERPTYEESSFLHRIDLDFAVWFDD